MYLVDDVHRVILPRTFKAASTSLQAALGSCTYAIGKEKAQNLLSYTWIIVARHPISRLASAWGMKDRLAMFISYGDMAFLNYGEFSGFVDSILNGSNINIHVTPQADVLYKPPDYIYHYETLSTDWEQLKQHFQSPDTLPRLHVNPSPVRWQDLFATLTAEQVDGLRQYYRRDFEMFGYD